MNNPTKDQNPPLKALIFDVDGTLADTERDGHRIAFNKAFQEAELDWDWTVELYGQLLEVTGGKERIRHFVNNYLEDPKAITDKHDLVEFSTQLHKRKTHYYLEMLQQGEIPLRTGVEDLLNAARAEGLRLAIATTTTPANVSYLLTSTLGEESLDWFEVIAAGDIVPAKKPAPDIYNYALEKMQLAPEEALAFEDSDNGIKSSTAANLKTVVTINGYTENHDFSKAEIVLDSFGDKETPFKLLGSKESIIEGLEDFSYVTIDMLKKLHANSI